VKKGLVLAVLVSFVFLTLGLFVFHASKASAQGQATYVGVDKCKGCHTAEFKDFESRKFSKAWSVLVMRGKDKDGECLKCHSTGYGQPGGFVSDETTPGLKYKQCEACHGPGSLHANNPGDQAAKTMMKQYVKDNDVCIKCHVCMKTHKSSEF
jgi:nitrate/TMAO reductase-like tetraheme cytochrome c subunit